jgi:LCP family protein required for cell wall assembly
VAQNKPGVKKWRQPRWLAAIILVFCLAAGIGYAAMTYSAGSDKGGFGEDRGGQARAAGQRLNFLLLGSDARNGETRARSDSIIFVSADPEKKQLALLSIPRDTLVDIPGHGRERINAAMLYGGPELTTRVVSDLIGQPVDYYLVTNYEGFVDLVDALGGVTLDVEKNMYHYDPEKGGRFTINLRKGVQRLDGRKALMYVRYRSDALGDISRVGRQQKFLRAVVEEMMKPRNLVRLPVLIPKIKDCIYTNLPLDQMLALARMAREMEGVTVVSGTLPGYFAGDPYWHVDPEEAKKAVAQLLSGEPITQFVKETPSGVMITQAVKPREKTQVVQKVYTGDTVIDGSYAAVTEETYGTVAAPEVVIVPGSGDGQPPVDSTPAPAQTSGSPPAANPSGAGTATTVYEGTYNAQ